MKTRELLFLLVPSGFYVILGLYLLLHRIPTERNIIHLNQELFQHVAQKAERGEIAEETLVERWREAATASEELAKSVIKLMRSVRLLGFCLLAGAVVQVYVILRVSHWQRLSNKSLQPTAATPVS